MANQNVFAHLDVDADYQLRLSVECPSCHERQAVPMVNVHTGMGFVCACSDEFPISVAAFEPVQRELDELRHLLQKTITLPI